jgi:hypothetical protein
MTEQAAIVAPANAIEARAALDSRKADPEWGAKIFAGDADANRELRELTAKAAGSDESVVAAVMSGEPGRMPTTETHIMAGTAGMLREVGIHEEIIKQVLKGHEVTEQEYKLVEAWKARHMKDPEFVKRFLNGDVEAREKMTLANITLAGGIKGKASI